MSLFQTGKFTLHSGAESDWIIDCNALSDADIATLAHMASKLFFCRPFGRVVGIPRGGLRMAAAMEQYITPDAAPILLVDDVLTTGGSLQKVRLDLHSQGVKRVRGLVIFSRNPVLVDIEPWITALFRSELSCPVLDDAP